MLLVFIMCLSLRLSSMGSIILFQEIRVVMTERSVVFGKHTSKFIVKTATKNE